MKQKLIIVGAGGHARPVLDAAELMGLSVDGLVDPNYQGHDEEINGHPVLGGMEIFDQFSPATHIVFIAIGDPSRREHYFHQIQSWGFKCPAVIHPTAIISKYAVLESGVFINAGSIINAGVRLDDDVIINTGVIIDHESVIGPHVHIGPGSNIAGRVRIGAKSFIGAGVTVIDKITIGEGSVIGAGSVIIENVADHTTVAGVPGRPV